MPPRLSPNQELIAITNEVIRTCIRELEIETLNQRRNNHIQLTPRETIIGLVSYFAAGVTKRTYCIPRQTLDPFENGANPFSARLLLSASIHRSG